MNETTEALAAAIAAARAWADGTRDEPPTPSQVGMLAEAARLWLADHDRSST